MPATPEPPSRWASTTLPSCVCSSATRFGAEKVWPVLAKLEPRHRAKLADLLAATPEFTRPDVDVALELIDCGLAEPTSDDYRFLIREEAEEILGYACFGATPMTEGCFDLYWLVVERKARRA